MTKNRKQEYLSIGTMIIIGVVFFFFIGEQGPVLCKDSATYLEYRDFNGVMPAYPLFISILRGIFGKRFYLYTVFVVQGIIALLCSMVLAWFVRKGFGLRPIESIVIFVLSLLPYAYTLPEDVVSHEIMTESLSFSVFYIFIVLLAKSMRSGKSRYCLWAALPLLGLILLRSHLIFLGLVYVATALYVYYSTGLLKNRKTIRNIFLLFLVMTAVIGGVFAVRSRVAEQEGNEKASQFMNAFFGKAMYIVEEDDYLLFEDEKMQEICKRLFASVDELERRLPYAKEGLLKWEDIIVGQNENMKLGNDVIYEYYIDTNPQLSYEEKLAMVEIDKTKFVKTMVINNLGVFLRVYLYLLPSSFLSMVFIQKRSIYLLCNIYGICFYVMFLWLLWRTYRKNLKKEFQFALLVLGTSVLNVLCTNFILYGMQRYMVYTFGLLYIAVFLMLRALWYCKKPDLQTERG